MNETGEAPPVPSSTKCTVDAMKWLEGQESMSFKAWVERKKKEQDNVAAMSTDELRAHKLQEKYVKLWRSRIRKCEYIGISHHLPCWYNSHSTCAVFCAWERISTYTCNSVSILRMCFIPEFEISIHFILQSVICV